MTTQFIDLNTPPRPCVAHVRLPEARVPRVPEAPVVRATSAPGKRSLPTDVATSAPGKRLPASANSRPTSPAQHLEEALAALDSSCALPETMRALLLINQALRRQCPWHGSGGAAIAVAMALGIQPSDWRYAAVVRLAEKHFTEAGLITGYARPPLNAFEEMLTANLPFVGVRIDATACPAAYMHECCEWIYSEGGRHAALAELVRWVCKCSPRPQWAAIFWLSVQAGLFEANMRLPAGWHARLEKAAKGADLRFFYSAHTAHLPDSSAVLAAAVVDDPDLWAECQRKARTLPIERHEGSTQADRLELFASLRREFAEQVAVLSGRTTIRLKGQNARRLAREKAREMSWP